MGHYLSRMARKTDNIQNLSEENRSGIIEMALSDHVSFADIRVEYGLTENEVKALMRQSLKPGSYRAWRKRVRKMSDQRATYK
ncbi:MAG: TIGR03643 family protein [Pseudomonadota bacterium]